MNWVTPEQFRKAPSEDAVVQKFAVGIEVKDDDRVRFIISDGSVDRQNDTVAPDGWELGSYKSNPVVLWAHSHKDLPVGKAVDVVARNGRLEADTEFADHPFAQTVRDLVKGGFLRAVSVGFRPLEWTINEERGGVDFKRQELLEFSVVPVPANANALIAASAEGIDVESLRKWIGEASKALPRAQRLHGEPEKEMGTRELEEMLRDALIAVERESEHLWVTDTFTGEKIVIYEARTEDSPWRLYARSYEIDGGAVKLGDTKRRVRRRIAYEPVAGGGSSEDRYALALTVADLECDDDALPVEPEVEAAVRLERRIGDVSIVYQAPTVEEVERLIALDDVLAGTEPDEDTYFELSDEPETYDIDTEIVARKNVKGDVTFKSWRVDAKAASVQAAVGVCLAFKPGGNQITEEGKRYSKRKQAIFTWVWEPRRSGGLFRRVRCRVLIPKPAGVDFEIVPQAEGAPVLHEVLAGINEVHVITEFEVYDPEFAGVTPHFTASDSIKRVPRRETQQMAEPAILDEDEGVYFFVQHEAWLIDGNIPAPNHGGDHNSVESGSMSAPPGDGAMGN